MLNRVSSRRADAPEESGSDAPDAERIGSRAPLDLAPPAPLSPRQLQLPGPRTSDPLLGTVIGERYSIEQILQTGGQGRVYRGRHVIIGKQVAIKTLLRPEDEQAQARFLREAQSISQVRHMHIVEVDDFG